MHTSMQHIFKIQYNFSTDFSERVGVYRLDFPSKTREYAYKEVINA